MQGLQGSQELQNKIIDQRGKLACLSSKLHPNAKIQPRPRNNKTLSAAL
jgi:hypothetical protein